ncbi:MAG: HAMP domain-containing histidine kinase, partial [Bacteroidales bacterium]|nr:HAMP domain-containing histidine kinase [Bacteroidales bacterium]
KLIKTKRHPLRLSYVAPGAVYDQTDLECMLFIDCDKAKPRQVSDDVLDNSYKKFKVSTSSNNIIKRRLLNKLLNRFKKFRTKLLRTCKTNYGKLGFALKEKRIEKEHKRLIKRLNTAQRNINTTNQALIGFLTNMNHELMTPLNGIIGFASILSESNLNKNDSLCVEQIKISGKRLSNTLNNILIASRIEALREEVNFKQTDIQHLVNKICTEFLPEAQKKGIELTLQEEHNSSVNHIYTDQYKLSTILTNIIKNAIQYTEKGTIELKYHISGRYLEFWIKDSGIGIAKEHYEAIYEKFYQVQFSNTRLVQGAGLGLFIVKKYLEMLNGKISLQSKMETGSEFHIKIPCKANDHMNELT